MAGDWIKFELSTPDKPEVWAIADSLSIDPDAVVGKLMRVWGWFDQQTETGNAPSVSKMLLDRLVGVNGFCKAVIDAGWMQDDGSTLTLPHFDRHNGKTAKNRALTAKRVAGHKAKTNAEGNEKLTQDALPREEKRREDNNNYPSDSVPLKELVELFNEMFPELPKVKTLTDKRKTALRRRWLENTKIQSVDRWRDFFEFIRKSDFLMGRTNPNPWNGFCFDWLINQGNFTKIIEGNYHK